ncbi:MAG: ThiF family adenylyltransferase [Thermoplasmatales archaeon]|nr:ThiF family adenylyltransferase [Thermoplasmatales archaeon]
MGNHKKETERYSRHILLKEIGEEGQVKLSKSSVVIIGCGALGNTIANNLVRAGIGEIKIIDRDIIEMNNLQRQILFDEEDLGLPKAWAAVKKLQKVNSKIKIKAVVEDLNNTNIEGIIKGADLVIDGTDNMETRFLINDACIKHKIPWIYGGAIGTHGMSMSIIPNNTPCFRCVFQVLPEPGVLPTCDISGVLNTIPSIIASIESTEALKILLGKSINNNLLIYDVWAHDFQSVKIKKNNECECCVKHNFEFLNAEKKTRITLLCGENAVQITPTKTGILSFESLAQKLQKSGNVKMSRIILRFTVDSYQINIFKSGRAIVYGTNDEKTAKSLYAKYVGL